MTNHNLSRRDFTGLMGASALAAFSLAGCGTQVGSGSESAEGAADKVTKEVKDMTADEEKQAWEKEPYYGKTIQAGYNGGVCLGAFGIAQVKGFYEEEGLDVEIVSTTSASDAVGTGKCQVSGDHIATLLVPAINGVKLTFTVGCQSGCKGLYVLADSAYQSTSDLAGKAVAIPDGVGNSDQNIGMRFLGHDGVDINTIDWKVVTTDAVVQAMQNGEVDAAILSDQFAKKFVDAGTLRVVRSLTFDADYQQEPCCIVAFNSDFIAENPVTAKKFTRAFRSASLWINENKSDALDLMFENNWASGDKDAAFEIMSDFNFDMSEELTRKALLSIIEDYKKYGIITATDDAETLLGKVWAPVLGDEA